MQGIIIIVRQNNKAKYKSKKRSNFKLFSQVFKRTIKLVY